MLVVVTVCRTYAIQIDLLCYDYNHCCCTSEFCHLLGLLLIRSIKGAAFVLNSSTPSPDPS